MAITRVETQVQWTGSVDSISVTSGGNQDSIEINLDATCVAARVLLKADNAGTPADGDIISFYWKETHGDPDGASTDEFTTNDPDHMMLLGVADTFLEDPAGFGAQLPIPQKGGIIRAVSGAASNAITVSATITEQRFA